MTGNRDRDDDAELIERLRALSRELVWPATPDPHRARHGRARDGCQTARDRDPDGLSRWQEVTVTGNVLLWQAGDVTLRLETPLDRESAIAVATSLR